MLGNVIPSCLCPLDRKFRIIAPHTMAQWRRWVEGVGVQRSLCKGGWTYMQPGKMGGMWVGEQRGLLGKGVGREVQGQKCSGCVFEVKKSLA